MLFVQALAASVPSEDGGCRTVMPWASLWGATARRAPGKFRQGPPTPQMGGVAHEEFWEVLQGRDWVLDSGSCQIWQEFVCFRSVKLLDPESNHATRRVACVQLPLASKSSKSRQDPRS